MRRKQGESESRWQGKVWADSAESRLAGEALPQSMCPNPVFGFCDHLETCLWSCFSLGDLRQIASRPPCDPDPTPAIANKRRICYASPMDEGRKRVIGIMAAILASLHMQTADDLFGTPQGSPRTDKLIAASIQWAEQIMRKIDYVFSK